MNVDTNADRRVGEAARGDDSGSFPPLYDSAYGPTRSRAPAQRLMRTAGDLGTVVGPGRLLAGGIEEPDCDLTTNARVDGVPIGERVVVSGRVLTEDDRPVPGVPVEIWQANAAGRYVHRNDQHDAPVDPNFSGRGRCVTDADGIYRFVSIEPGAYPVPGTGIWRPKHIHFSVFGRSWASRLVTQMYFPGDPLLAFDPIFLSIPPAARERLVAAFAPDLTEADWALGYRFDIVVTGSDDGVGAESHHG